MEEEKTLRDSFHGSCVWRNCDMEFFKKQQSSWIAKAQSIERKKALIHDLFKEEKVVKVFILT